MDRNSKEEIRKWAINALKNSTISNEYKRFLLQKAELYIKAGMLRGDISNDWMKEGLTTAEIPDMYP